MERLRKHAAGLIKDEVPAILAGDYNVVPTSFDIYPSKSSANDALVQPESRAAFKRIVDQGWTDAIRALHPKEPMYTFWHPADTLGAECVTATVLVPGSQRSLWSQFHGRQAGNPTVTARPSGVRLDLGLC